MTQLELRSLPINLASSDEDNSLSGIVNVPGSRSEVLTNPLTGRKFREVIQPGTFKEALKEAETVDFLYQHDKEQILSTTDNASLYLEENDAEGLVMKAKITQTSWGKDAYQMIKDGIVRSMSFGMNVLHDTWVRGEDGVPLRIIDKIHLIEVSAVRNPAYAASLIEARGIDIAEVEIPDLEEEDLADVKKKEVEEKVEPAKKEVPAKTEKREGEEPVIADTEVREDEVVAEDIEERDDEVVTDEPEVHAADSAVMDALAELTTLVKAALDAFKQDETEERDEEPVVEDAEIREDEEVVSENTEVRDDEVVVEDPEVRDDEEVVVEEERSLTKEQEAILEFFG